MAGTFRPGSIDPANARAGLTNGGAMQDMSRYARIIESIFLEHHTPRAKSIPFERQEIVETAKKLKIELPKNIGDLIYSFRYRTPLPESIRARAPKGKEWIIRPAGKGRYRFVAVSRAMIALWTGTAMARPRLIWELTRLILILISTSSCR